MHSYNDKRKSLLTIADIESYLSQTQLIPCRIQISKTAIKKLFMDKHKYLGKRVRSFTEVVSS